MTDAVDVLVVGEVLAELSSDGRLQDAAVLRLSFSGDALNAAAAAAAAGASVGLLARIGDDELGDALAAHVAACGVRTEWLRRVPRPNGLYIVTPAPDANGGFVYVRRGSAGSTLEPADIDSAPECRALVVSGIGQAISSTAAAAVELAARRVYDAGGTVVYDPNFRPRLTTAAVATEALRRIAPSVSVAIPSHPVETRSLLGADEPEAAAAACRRLGAEAVVVTCGAEGALLSDGTGTSHVPAAPAPGIVDATGAGDVFAGTLAAALANDEPLDGAARAGTRAAALSLGARGGRLGSRPFFRGCVRWRGELHRDAEPPGGPGGEGEGPVVCLGDALDDRQAEADAGVVGADASAAALKRLGKRGDQLRGELLAGVLDGEHHALGVSAGRDPHACPARAGCGRSRCARGSSPSAAGARVSRWWGSRRRRSRW